MAAFAVTLGAASAEARALKSFVLPEAVHQMDEADVPRAAPRPRVRAAPLGLPPGFWTAERKAAVQRQVERFLAERDAGEDERATIAAEALNHIQRMRSPQVDPTAFRLGML